LLAEAAGGLLAEEEEGGGRVSSSLLLRISITSPLLPGVEEPGAAVCA
jgi:hypothetical protein